jgi:hypothetical protein
VSNFARIIAALAAPRTAAAPAAGAGAQPGTGTPPPWPAPARKFDGLALRRPASARPWEKPADAPADAGGTQLEIRLN